MKKTGTGNRFNEQDKLEFFDNDKCWVCLANQWDALHHIICNSVKGVFVPGDHNKSILNAAPIHNYSHPNSKSGKSCHVGNESYLYKEETIRELLIKTYTYLIRNQYRFNDRDREFMRVYKKFYENF